MGQYGLSGHWIERDVSAEYLVAQFISEYLRSLSAGRTLKGGARLHASYFPEGPERTTSMTPEEKKTADKMTAVKAEWDKAPAGAKKDASLKHYRAAEKAHTAKNDAETNKELDAAKHALA